MNTTELNRRTFIQRSGLATAGFAFLHQSSHAEDRPNILWITAEDLSPHLGCYGDPYAITPTLDQLAQEGIRYNHAYSTAPLCTPARSSIITGVFASSMGTQHLRGEMPLSSSLHCFPEFLREAGYYCTNNVKEDYNFVAPKNGWDESSTQAHWRNRKPGQPFFSVFNFMTTHQSQTRYSREDLEKVNQKLAPEERHDPAQAPLPPYYPDTPDVRNNVAVFHTQVTLMDKQVKEILEQLEEDGLADNTLVFFYGDHGDGLPRGKRWLHDTGMRVPLIIHFPQKFQNAAPAKPGSTIDRMVSFVDFAPTVLSLAGIPPKDYMQGKAFLGSYENTEREYIYGIRDRVDEVYECSRSIRDHRYHYIRNFMPHRKRMQRSFFSELTPIRQELRRLDKEGALKGHETWLMADTIPVEELYDTENDPWELNNLAEDPHYQDLMRSLHRKLLDWMIETRDLSLFPETEMIALANGHMPYDFGQNLPPDKLQEILYAADLVGRGSKHLEVLQKALGSSEAAVRYWAATGLAALGKQAQPVKEELIKTLEDPSAAVRFTAAEALCSIGEEEKTLPILRNGLLDENVRNQLHASHVLMQIGEKAKPAFPEMKIALEQLKDHPDIGWYTRENLQYMLNTY